MTTGFTQWLSNIALMFSASKWESLFAKGGPELLRGLGVTLVAAAGGLVIALALGVVFGVLSSSQWKVPRFLARVYVEFFQNTPLLLQVVFLGFGLPIIWPAFGVIPSLFVGMIGVGIYHGAYISEAVRAGIQSIHKGQLEASLSQGFSYIRAMQYVVIPQAMRVVLPPLTNQAVSLIKNTSVLMFIGAMDLMYKAEVLQNDLYNPGPTFLIVMLMYFALCYPLAFLARRLEDRTEVS